MSYNPKDVLEVVEMRMREIHKRHDRHLSITEVLDVLKQTRNECLTLLQHGVVIEMEFPPGGNERGIVTVREREILEHPEMTVGDKRFKPKNFSDFPNLSNHEKISLQTLVEEFVSKYQKYKEVDNASS